MEDPISPAPHAEITELESPIITFKIAARKIDRSDKGPYHCDPYFKIISKATGNVLYKSEYRKNEKNPSWDAVTINFSTMTPIVNRNSGSRKSSSSSMDNNSPTSVTTPPSPPGSLTRTESIKSLESTTCNVDLDQEILIEVWDWITLDGFIHKEYQRPFQALLENFLK